MEKKPTLNHKTCSKQSSYVAKLNSQKKLFSTFRIEVTHQKSHQSHATAKNWTFFPATTFFSISIYVFFYLYQWWLTFKLLFCVLFSVFSSRQRDFWKERRRQLKWMANPNRNNLFSTDGDFLFQRLNPIKRFPLTPTMTIPKSWIEINVFFM